MIRNIKYKRNKMCFLILFLFMLCSGCGKNPLTTSQLGIVTMGATQHQSSYSFTPILFSGSYISDVIELNFTIEKIEFTTDGIEWIEIFKGNIESKMGDIKSGVNLSNMPFSTKPDEYHGIRIWTGKKLRAKGILINGQIIERESDNGDKEHPIYYKKGYPHVFTTRNGSLEYPFTVKGGKNIYIILSVVGLSGFAMPANEDYKPYLAIEKARVTEIKP